MRIEYEGIVGMFFPMATSRLILCELRELSLRRSLVGLQNQENELWQLQVDFVERQLTLAIDARDELENVLERSEQRANEAESRAELWWRSPVFIASISIVLTIAVILGGGYLINTIYQ
jgi:hypothetical protein